MTMKWFSTGYLQSKPTGAIDLESGVIEGALIVTEGEAKGHEISLEKEFVEAVVKLGNDSKGGLKGRFGHPNMCSTALGTFLGRWKNFRLDTVTRNDGSKASAARADLFLSASAKDTPNGDLYAYVLNLARSEGDIFGTSIVFSGGEPYRRTESGKKVTRKYEIGQDGKPLYGADGSAMFRWVDESGKEVNTAKDAVVEKDYAECDKLHACDCVDEPAANDGMFSKFSQESLAGQVTEFLDLNPEVWTAVDKQPEILGALAKYGDQIEGFIGRYRAYLEHNNKRPAMSEPDNTVPPEPMPEPVDNQEPTAPDTPPEPTPEPVPDPTPQASSGSDEQPEGLEATRQEFAKMRSEFGDAIAADVFANGGSYADAVSLAYKRASEENAALKVRIEELSAQSTATGKPVKVTEHKPPAKLFNTGK